MYLFFLFFDNINSEMRKIETKNRKFNYLKIDFIFFAANKKHIFIYINFEVNCILKRFIYEPLNPKNLHSYF